MTDPLRRDPTEFLRTLKRMTNFSSWQKCLLFASKGRMIGFKLGIQHYNTILFSQCLWGRALEIVRVIRAMEEDGVRPNGISYYYICNGMANADHGINYGFNMNHQLAGIQHWRVASSALMACEHNGYDPTDTMYNSAIITCTIPVMNHWRHASAIFQRMLAEERSPHPQMVDFFVQCLIRNKRPREAAALMRYAHEAGVKGYEEKGRDLPDVFAHLPPEFGNDEKIKEKQQREKKQLSSAAADGPSSSASQKELLLEQETEMELERERELEELTPKTDGHHPDEGKPFRPRVYRGMWYKWHAIANRYRPTESLHRRQIAPRHSPTGIPGFNRV